MALLEYTVGNESHSSFWGKFYVKGLEKYEIKEGGSRTKHESYAELAADVPDGAIFTVFSQSGNKRGTDAFDFYICEARRPGDTASCRIDGGCYGKGGVIVGNYVILCRGAGTTKAPRLMGWWQKLGEKCAAYLNEDGKLRTGTRKRFAFWCAEHLEKRGLKELPEMPAEYNPPAMADSHVEA